MATTVDHLRVDHHITVLKNFIDSRGTAMQAGDRGILRGLSFDQINLEIRMVIECEAQTVSLSIPLHAVGGPRNGHMKEYFALGVAALDDTSQIIGIEEATPPVSPESVNDEDRLVQVEQEILDRYDHIGAAASVAEMYAQRMRAFLAQGNITRAVAAFKLANQWMATYASWATSGGEGAALSYERDKFYDQLVRELGFEPK